MMLVNAIIRHIIISHEGLQIEPCDTRIDWIR
jgi:hypothetical protein